MFFYLCLDIQMNGVIKEMSSPDFFRDTWGNLSWTPWVSFADTYGFRQLPDVPGLSRVRAINGQELFYVGETGRSLQGRLGDLRRNTLKAMMPFNDPHTAAPSLWAWRDADQLEFECSVAPIESTSEIDGKRLRGGLKYYLLWQYRLEFGSSTRCNHGRFHPRYAKSSDRNRGIQGSRLPDDMPDNPAGGPSLAPLRFLGTPISEYWMGLSWTTPVPLNNSIVSRVAQVLGAYKIIDMDQNEIIYIGESENLKNRLSTHAKKSWSGIRVFFSYVEFTSDTLPHQRHEIENDLIGSFYALRGVVPRFQLGGM
jgi:hypothetical protein